jgi:CDGSH-type Zn-finger protein
MSVIIKVMDDGPYMVIGDVDLVDMNDKKFQFDESQQIALCRCGKTSSEPFCDGSHITIEYKSRPRAD